MVTDTSYHIKMGFNKRNHVAVTDVQSVSGEIGLKYATACNETLCRRGAVQREIKLYAWCRVLYLLVHKHLFVLLSVCGVHLRYWSCTNCELFCALEMSESNSSTISYYWKL